MDHRRKEIAHIIREIRRPDAELVAAFARIAPATIHEAMGRKGAVGTQIKPIYSGMRACGTALTVECHPGDNLMLHKALSMAKPGDIIVAFMGNVDTGGWGEVLATSAMARGVRALVLDGYVRDGIAIREMGFPVFARGLCMKGTVKETLGSVNHVVRCGDVWVEPGDIVAADDDGVVVVPQAEATWDLVQRCQAREEKESKAMATLREGKCTTYELMHFDEKLKSLGATEA